jgi:hypothetical protein
MKRRPALPNFIKTKKPEMITALELDGTGQDQPDRWRAAAPRFEGRVWVEAKGMRTRLSVRALSQIG